MIIESNERISELNSDRLGGTILGNNNIENFSSDLFSGGLSYNDLKDAHKNSLLKVNDDPNKKRFKNATDYKLFRDSERYKMLNETEALKYFEQKELECNESSVQTAYQLTKEYEVNMKKNSKLWSKMQQINNY